MPRRIIEVDGVQWSVAVSGRTTQYTKDEFGLVFSRVGAPNERRVTRYSPAASKAREQSLAQLSDEQLRTLLTFSQPAWTAPEMGYRR